MTYNSHNIPPVMSPERSVHLLLPDDARRSLEDISAGRVPEADAAIAELQQRRGVAVKSAKRRR